MFTKEPQRSNCAGTKYTLVYDKKPYIQKKKCFFYIKRQHYILNLIHLKTKKKNILMLRGKVQHVQALHTNPHIQVPDGKSHWYSKGHA